MSSANFWNKIADKYAKDPISDQESYEYKLGRTQSYFHPDMSVLEIACGTGSTALIHASLVKSYKAIDISERMIEIARSKPGAGEVEFEVADIESQSLGSDRYDMVQTHSALHLLNDTEAAIEKIYQALKPGGLFVSSTTCVGGLWWLKLLAPIGQAIGKLPTLSWFSEEDLRAMMQNAGFEIIEDWRPKGKIKALFLVARKPNP